MFRNRTLDPILAAALSFWMAAAACVMGCMQPLLASTPQSEVAVQKEVAPQNEPAIAQSHSRHQAHASPMPDMDCCSRDKTPSGPASNKTHHHQAVSCCPLDARLTPAQKFAPPSAIAFKSDAVSSTTLDLPFPLFRRSSLIDDALSHTGRDTLRKTRVLRI